MNFISNNTNFDSLKNHLSEEISDSEIKFFLKHNNLRLENIFDFYKSQDKIFALCGFQSTGKSKLIESSLYFLDNNILKVQYDCPQSVCFDDILLFIYSAFSEMNLQGLVHLKKPNVQDFFELVKQTFKQIKKPILLIFNSFENCLNDNNKTDIVKFFDYLCSLDNVKIIFSARTFDIEEEGFNKFNIQKATAKALEKETIEILFKENNINYTQNSLENFYSVSRGYFGYVKIVMNMLKTFSISLDEYMEEYALKKLSYDDFMFTKFLSLVSGNLKDILYFLSIVRINFPMNLLFKLNLATKDELNYLIKKNLIVNFKNYIYVKNFIRNHLLKDIQTYTKQKIHKFLYDFYEAQLPLKPKERDIRISRATMRNEIKYHSNFIQDMKKENANKNLPKSVNMSLINYSGNLKDANSQNLISKLEKQKYIKQDKPKYNEKNSITSDSGTVYVLNEDMVNTLRKADRRAEKHIMAEIEDEVQAALKDFEPEDIKDNLQNQNSEKPKKEIKPIKIDFMQLAQNAENLNEYQQANDFYEEALGKEEYQQQFPIIKTKMALNLQKVGKIEEAISLFYDAYKVYENKNELNKANYILANIGNMHRENFQYTKAKNIYYQILSQKEDLSVLLKVYCIFGLAEIENANSNFEQALKFYNEVLKYIDNIADIPLKCEILFKYGLINDDLGNTDNAMNFYNKSVNTSSDMNRNLYLSSCYSNIASIYEERKLNDKAIEFYEKSLDIDIKQNNNEGQYYCYSNLAKNYEKINNDKADLYFTKAIDTAKLIKDDFYIAEAYLKYGDYFYNKRNNEQALKYYLQASAYITFDVSNINARQIKTRLKDIKIKMGAKLFEDKVKEYVEE